MWTSKATIIVKIKPCNTRSESDEMIWVLPRNILSEYRLSGLDLFGETEQSLYSAEEWSASNKNFLIFAEQKIVFNIIFAYVQIVQVGY